MKMNLEGKLALVTGSTKGIGKAIAIELAKEGMNVIINGRQKETVDEIVAEIKKIILILIHNQRHMIFQMLNNVKLYLKSSQILIFWSTTWVFSSQ